MTFFPQGLTGPSTDVDGDNLRLFLEDVCCELTRFDCVAHAGADPEAVRIDRECYLGTPGNFADIRVTLPGQSPYFIEVKFGYPPEQVQAHVVRKYGKAAAPVDASRIVLVTDGRWPEVFEELRESLQAPLEVWSEEELRARIEGCFGFRLDSLATESLLEARSQINRAKGWIAFGGPSREAYENDPLNASLIWHFSFWRLKQLRETYGLQPRDMLSPGRYRNVVALLADICSFSSFVRDTPNPDIVLHELTNFYTKSRYQIVNRGGMLANFVGDEVVAFFGLPDRRPGYLVDAVETACALLDLGHSIAHDWQRHIDREQKSGGIHIGMAVGDIEVFPQRPFSRTHMGQVGDTINMAARLMAVAGPGEIVISNSLYHEFGGAMPISFSEVEALEAKNVGRIKAWKHRSAAVASPAVVPLH